MIRILCYVLFALLCLLIVGHNFVACSSVKVNRGVFQGLPEPNRAWLLGNRSLTPVASGRPLVYTRSHKLFHIRKVGGVAR